MKYRIEKDSIGEMKIPVEAYYGIYTLRSKENFEITKRGLCRQMIKGLSLVKKAAAKANCDAGRLGKKEAEAIALSCDEILNGRLHGQFITDLIQGGAGLSMNMNANEVICNRANEMLGSEKGKYDIVDPIRDLNMGQSTNEVIPTAGKICSIRLTKKLIVEGKKLCNSFLEKASELDEIIKTHPDTYRYQKLKEEFERFNFSLSKALKQMDVASDLLLEISLGFTTSEGTEADDKYMKKVIKYLNQYSGDEYYQSKNLFDGTRNLESFVSLSGAVKRVALNLSGTANDLRIMTTAQFYDDILKLPDVQAATNSTYEKIYPVILEMVNQVAFAVIGSDVTISKAAESNYLDYNMNIPVILSSLFENINLIRRAVITLREKAIDGIKFIIK